MQLMTKKEALRKIRERVKSREWYIIPAASELGTKMAIVIENKFYSGPLNDYFELVMIPCPTADCRMMGLFLAKKEYMSCQDLQKFLEIPEPLDEEQDVLVTPDLPLSVLEWLQENFGGG